jgi:membrane protease YdiL (CAAX protease family)
MNAPLSRRAGAWLLLLTCIAPAVAGVAASTGFGVPPRPVSELLWRLGAWAVLEELAFRGAVHPWLAGRPALAGRSWWGLSAPNVLTGLAFAVAHAFTRPPEQALAMWPVSLVLGLALEHSGRLLAPVLLHLYFNGLLWLASVLLSGLRA